MSAQLGRYYASSVATAAVATAAAVLVLLPALLSSFRVMAASQTGLNVRVRAGNLRGVLVTDGSSTSYVAFKGIPYAKPPTGKLRFKAPQPPDDWSGTLNANKDGPVCPQFDPKTKTVVGDENCLFLNVYTPQRESDKSESKSPVLVLIHGGQFQTGSGSSKFYNPKTLIDQNILVVTLNYRLGVLGFLSTTDEFSPGNYGLLDQLEALRWIQQNIDKFGGDVHQVTLLGHDAGAASAIFHLVSPLSKGIFHQVIALSGSPVCDQYLQKDPKKWAVELGTRLDCYMANSYMLLECFRKHGADELVSKANEMHVFSNYPAIFVPAVERVYMENGDFLPDTPINRLKEGLVNRAPIIIGVSRTEGEIFQKKVSKVFDNGDPTTFFKKSLTEILSVATSLKYNRDAIASAIEKEYFSDVTTNNEAEFQNATKELYADMLVRRCADVTARLLSNTGWPTYMYVIERSDNAGQPNVHYELNLPDELSYVFGTNEDNGQQQPQLSEEETAIRRTVIHTWTNFMKTSMPTPNKSPELPLTWIPMNPGKIRYLRVAGKSVLVDGYLTERMDFWNNRVPKIEIGGKPKEEL